MKSTDPIKIAVLPGDGIGIEVTEATLPVFEVLDVPAILSYGDIGWEFWKKEGTAIPSRTWQLIASSDTVLLGAITSKPQREAKQELSKALRKSNPYYVSPVIQLRQGLDLFANIRPCFSIDDQSKPFNFCIIRENSEGLYCGFDYFPLPKAIHNLLAESQHWQTIPADEASCALRLQSKPGLTRLFDFAFNHAMQTGMPRVTLADKPNVLRESGEFARKIFESTAQKYPKIQADILNVDAVALWLIKSPEKFGVIVAENMFGDILSDVGAGVMGGLGLAPSANIGDKGSYFEPVHGSGPRMKKNCANPSAMFLTISMLLNHFGYPDRAKKIVNAVMQVIKEKRYITYDLGGHSTTTDMANAVIERCARLEASCLSTDFNPVPKENIIESDAMGNLLQQLMHCNSAEISDALDSCGIEGGLLNIKPLSQGMKMVGPAYTIQYLPREKKEAVFHNAANYIDKVPKHSVIVIDNNGQTDCTVWGDLLTHTALRNNIMGTVVHGAVRDVESIRSTNYPVFCTGIYMCSGKNRVYKANEQCPLFINGVTINPGDIVFADDNGVLVIPNVLLHEVVNKAIAIRLTEERIKAAVASGSTLEQAREDYYYEQPWLGINKKREQ
ncbi:TPA: isocitrate/isopropylmalate family dehydrogenase [Legionella pneumophila]|uniref:isocitrate/isopropylmalate family dehydrogenase n=1 Tax=Legionella pneumophila TaxID=446 RepID=UPI0007773165|nr:isocitrate/isopropylmalate family dehydrogenase [Legionella pneumophila]HAU0828051.1 isocitrate/isopropylmalate dehydrogenase family protein [Legionella pneumophila]HBD7059215.1 isocitrate/isopropylmalate dehydrogenase family protein [Legionella pneumophila]HEM7040968.1 isocitrate/isopropylmalate dehydrogenase family protein [Legionella pneumophila]HEO1426696.1 isocitrate/isopropylmalate dehydrogenase family protein [Legionella pneumophila]HEO1451598.1 isocitrate/isopropylmalate dehydrogena